MGELEVRVGKLERSITSTRLSAVAPIWNLNCLCKLKICTNEQLPLKMFTKCHIYLGENNQFICKLYATGEFKCNLRGISDYWQAKFTCMFYLNSFS